MFCYSFLFFIFVIVHTGPPEGERAGVRGRCGPVIERKIMSNRNLSFLLAILFSLLTVCPVGGAEIWVSPDGSDREAGTADRPMRSVAAAVRKARELRRLNDPSTAGGVRIVLRGGVYPQDETLFLRPEDGGTAESPTVICAAPGEYPVLSGGMAVTGWRPVTEAVPGLPQAAQGKVWAADIPKVGNRRAEFRQLWVNGRKAVRARTGEPGNMARLLSFDPAEGTIGIPVPAEGLPQDAGQMEMTVLQRWAVAFLRVKGIEIEGDTAVLTFHDPESRLEFEHPWPQPVIGGERGNSAFMLNNAIGFLDAPSEWYADFEQGKIYYLPREGEDMTTAEAVVPVLETIVEVAGTAARPIAHVRFEGVGFEYAGWMRPSRQGHVPLQTGMYLLDAYKLEVPGLPEKAGLENQAWIGRPAAAVSVSGTEGMDFVNCRFRHLASTGLDYVRCNRNAAIEGCVFRDIGGTGLLAGAFPDRGYETHVAYVPDFEGELCRDMRIRNNLVTNAANEDWGCVGIGVGYAAGVDISHNEVSDVPYSGISLGWGWTTKVTCARDNRIAHNRVHGFAGQLYDAGGIYTLSVQPGTVIENNWIYDLVKAPYATNDRAFYIYFDEGTGYVDARNNLTPDVRFDANSPGPGNRWEKNGPSASPRVKDSAGLMPAYRHLLEESRERR